MGPTRIALEARFGDTILTAALIAMASPSVATVKVCDSDPDIGLPGDRIQYPQNPCPAIRVSPGTLQGAWMLMDNGTGMVTLTGSLRKAASVDWRFLFGSRYGRVAPKRS